MSDPLVDIECERALLGAVLLDPTSYFEAHGVDRNAFGDPRHAVVWDAFAAITERGDAPDSVSALAAEIQRTGRLQAIGGRQFLSELTDAIPTAAHVPVHARLLVGLAQHRAARDTLTTLAQWASSPALDPEQVLARVERVARELTGGTSARDTIGASALMEALADDLSRPPEELPGLATPFAELTRALGGWQPGQLIVIAARPSVGKTALALLAALETARAGAAVMICSLETRSLPLSRRLAALDSGVDLDGLLRRRPLDAREIRLVQDTLVRVAAMPLTVVQEPEQTLSGIVTLARRQKARSGLALLVVDYLQLVKVVREKGRNREQEVAEISRGLKVLGLSLGIPVILLAQLSRDVEKDKRRPRLSDLRESGSIEQDADVVLFLHREGDPNPARDIETVELHVAKARDGAAGTQIPLSYHKRTTTFRSPGAAHAPSAYTAAPEPVPSHFHPDEFGDQEPV